MEEMIARMLVDTSYQPASMAMMNQLLKNKVSRI
jgi:hypothetical protein